MYTIFLLGHFVEVVKHDSNIVAHFGPWSVDKRFQLVEGVLGTESVLVGRVLDHSSF